MLSPRMAKVMLHNYRKDKPVPNLEPKFGWGHEAWVKELAEEIKTMHFDSTWSPAQVLNYVSKFVLECERQNPSSVKHLYKPM